VHDPRNFEVNPATLQEERDAPKVSVLMPMRNAGPYLAAAIESILAQDYPRLELVIVDDGSTDGSREYVSGLRDPRIFLYDGPRSGISACMNVALDRAIGELVMRCDADDLYPPGRIRRQVAWLNARPDFIAVCGSFCMIGKSGQVVAAPLAQMTVELPDAQQWIQDRRLRTHLCTFAVRLTAARRLGGFRPWFETAEDIDFALRLASEGLIGYQPADAYQYRLHSDSITHTQASVRRQFFEAAAIAMSQERRAGGQDALMRGEAPALPSTDGAGSRPDEAGKHIAQLLIGQAWQAFQRGDRAASRLHAWRAVRACTSYFDAWKSLLLVCFKPLPKTSSR